MLLFVYGTLKQGYCRSSALENQQFLGNAVTTAEFHLWDCGEYPALTRASASYGVAIQGELYRIDRAILPQLDELEAVDTGLYQREPISLQRPAVQEEVIAYLFQGQTERLKKLRDHWPAD